MRRQAGSSADAMPPAPLVISKPPSSVATKDTGPRFEAMTTPALSAIPLSCYPEMKVVIAPDKFKATLTATEACEAIAMGVRAALPQAEIATFPMSDGGEGFAEVLATTLGGRPFSLGV